MRSGGASAGLVAAVMVAGCFARSRALDGPEGTGSGGTSDHPESGGSGASAGAGGNATAGQAGSTAGGTGGSAMAGTAGATGGGAGENATAGQGGSTSGSAGAGQAGTGGARECSFADRCGGDLVGTWTVVSSCVDVHGGLDLRGFGLGCTSASVTGILSVTGTFTANADGTYSDQTYTSGAQQIEFPEQCFDVGPAVSCDRLASVVLLDNYGYASATCMEANDGACVCDAVLAQTSGMAIISGRPASSGRYDTADGVMTLTDGAEPTGEYEYCVSENELNLRPPTDKGSVVLARQ